MALDTAQFKLLVFNPFVSSNLSEYIYLNIEFAISSNPDSLEICLFNGSCILKSKQWEN
jgi:hypothetical protein